MATDRTRFPGGGDAIVPKASVKEIRVERIEGKSRGLGLLLEPDLGCHFRLPSVSEDGGIEPLRSCGSDGWHVCAPVGGGVLGYFLGKQLDRQTTIVTVVD